MQNAGMHGSTPAGAGQDYASASDQAMSKLSQLTDTAQQTIERLTHVASNAASRIGERGQDLWAAQAPNVEKARLYMREHPLVAIGIAVAVGVVLAKLISRR